MTDRELAGCPCCGKPARFSDEYQNADGEWAVECSACNLLSWTVEDWNRRTPSSEGDGRDGERWRYVRAHMDCLHLPGLDISGPSEERIDAAIDAAIAAAAAPPD